MKSFPETAQVPKPSPPGPEMEALLRFHPDVTWTGRISEGGMGPDTPEMTAVGEGHHHVIQAGRWVVGDYEQDQFLLDGTFVLTWQLHWVAGWDPTCHCYRATIADNYGHADVMAGQIEGDRLVFETMGDPPVRIRLMWEISEHADITWINEVSVERGPWRLVETYDLTPKRR